MTDQELFDKVATHLLAQKVKSEEDGYCAYRGEDGTSCAIGCLIPDSKYEKRFEGTAIDSEIDPVAVVVREAAGVKPEQVRLAGALQHVHDASPPWLWENDLEMLAQKYNLDPSVVT